MEKAIILILGALLLIPPVTGATLTCPTKAPLGEITCGLEGNGTGIIYLESVDGIPAKDYTIIIEHNHRDFVSSSNVHDTFELPAKVIFWADNVLGSIVDSYVGSLPHWIFMNKEHTFVFNIVMENGSTKVFEQRIFLTGNPTGRA
ncbi:hypothetical protein [Thermococcus sp.]